MIEALHWTVPAGHPAFAGHFPGTPILPGVVLLDTALGAIAAATGIALDTCAIASVKFLNAAAPGDEIIIRYKVTASAAIRFDIVDAADALRKIASGSIVPQSPPTSGRRE